VIATGGAVSGRSGAGPAVKGPRPATGRSRGRTWDLTVLGTSDTHGHVHNWDYYRDAEYDDSAHNDVGVAKVATLVNRIRAERRGRATLVLDAGDTIEGTPLATYYAKREPIASTGAVHPMAHAMNVIGYDAVTLGNHEFDYGLPHLEAWIGQLDSPALAANAVHETTGLPAFRPFVVKDVLLARGVPPLRVGILGLTNPGTAVWDRAYVEGRLRFLDMVTTAARWVAVMRLFGTDLVIVSAHGGDSGMSTFGSDLPNENPATHIAEQVPGIDAILLGHAHAEIPERFVTNPATGRRVLLSEPSYAGKRLTRMDFTFTRRRGRWRVADSCATTLNTNTVPEDPAVLGAVKTHHATTVAYVNRVVARCTVELSTAESRYRATAIIDFVNRVQTDTVAAAMAGGPYAGLPVLSVVAPYRRAARFPAGDVKIRDVAGFYVFDNPLEAVLLTGAQVRAYLEHAARYFRTLAPGIPVDPATISDPAVRDYNVDIMSGVDYDIDISRPVGGRITRLTDPATGAEIAPTARFLVAVNSYRRGGGGNYPGIVTTPVFTAEREIRQLLIDWAQAHGRIDPVDFFRPNWRLVRDGIPVF
jgi:2',3'-cyclic-nucleotide 2'-phosphodiesterase/3'-nucleotidase